MSLHKEPYRVVWNGNHGAPTCCTVGCNRSGGIFVQVYGDSHGASIDREYGSPEIAGAVARAFTLSFTGGLFALICDHLGARLPAALSYLREFTRAMFTHWILVERATGGLPAGPPGGLIEGWIQLAHETPDLERLSGDAMSRIWQRMKEKVHESMKDTRLSLTEFMAQRDPSWGRIGTIVFKLDDVMEEAARPFVLITSYFDSITATKCALTTPISVPIFGECRVPGLRKRLYDLLRRAAQCSGVVRRLVESQEIFSPCSLIPRDAHAFLRDVPAIEALGIEVALPRWWKDLKQPEIRVRTRVGSSAPKPIGIEARLDLETAYVVGEHVLSEAQWRAIIRNDHDQLAYIGGQWVELVRGRVAAAVLASARVQEMHAQGGVTYAQALELTAAPLPGDEPSISAAPASAAIFERGEWFEEAHSAITRRNLRRGMEPGVRLRGDLFGYQRQGIAWLSTLMEVGAGACLADDMGLGKTMQVIALIVVLLRRQVAGPHLIVVPASLLNNWQREFERFAPTVEVGIVHGGARDAGEALPYVTLTSYGTLPRRPALLERQWGLVVLDEAQEIRNPDTQVAQTVKRLHTRMRVCLTGTPIANQVVDLWSIMDFLNPGLLGSESEFRAWFGEHCQGVDGLGPLRRRVRPFMLRRLKTDPEVALDLPSKVEMTVYCGMTALQAALYGQTYTRMRAEFETSDNKTRQGIAFKVLIRLKQICDHPGIVLDQVYDPHSSGKFIRLAELAASIAASGDKMLVFTQYQVMVAPIAEHLENVFARAGAILDGNTPIKRRQEIVAEFQRDDGPPFLVLTFGVGGTGYTLTAASHVVFFDRWWNPAVENQAMDRAFRIGQTKGVVVHKFVCRGTLEERIDALISRKHEMAKDLFGGGDDSELSKLSTEELLSLIALDPSLACLDEA